MKKLFILLTVFILIFSFCSSVSAAEDKLFTSELPDYVDYSGGAWFETFNSVLGRCTVIFPLEFKDNCFGFSLSDAGVPVDIINVTNSTVYGTVIASDGTKYSCRASRFSSIEYQTSQSYGSSYIFLSPDAETLSNTNMFFVTDDENYINDSVPDYDKYYLFIFSFIGFCEFMSLCSNLLRRGRR